MRLLTLILGAAIIVTATNKRADARPVSYPSGITGMTMNDGERHSAHIHYSPTATYSLGYKFEHRRDEDVNLHAVQMNNLLRRWNKKDSQANLYLKSGAGVAYQGGDSAPAFFTGLATDWETQRHFVSYENRYDDFGRDNHAFSQSARIGIAPYIGDYGDLHTWLMLQADHRPESDENITITPLIRLFKGVHMLEAGVSNHGDALLNYVIRY